MHRVTSDTSGPPDGGVMLYRHAPWLRLSLALNPKGYTGEPILDPLRYSKSCWYLSSERDAMFDACFTEEKQGVNLG